MAGLADLLRQAGRDGEAEPLFREALEGRQKSLGVRHRETMQSTRALTTLLRDIRQDAEEAEVVETEAKQAALDAEIGDLMFDD